MTRQSLHHYSGLYLIQTFDDDFTSRILDPLRLKETKDSPFKEALLDLKSKND